jgi:hypothetical protein
LGRGVQYNSNGEIISIEYTDKNQYYHRLDGPAYIQYWPNKWRYSWFVDGLYHREDGPAQVNIELNGGKTRLMSCYYGFQGKLYAIYSSYLAVKCMYNSIITKQYNN